MRLRDGSMGTTQSSSASGSPRAADDVFADETYDGNELHERESDAPDGDTNRKFGREDSSLDSPLHQKLALRRSTSLLPARPGTNADTTRYARELKAILARLANSQSPQRTQQRMVIAGVDTGPAASAVARGLATTCAASGFRVLLIDMNLDDETVQREFGVSNELGLGDLLSSSGSPHRFPQATNLPNLAVITAGSRRRDFSSLLSRERVFHRLEPIARHFEYIIIDAGALAPSLVGRVSEGADNVIVAVKEHVSSVRELGSMLRTLRAETGPEPAVLMIG